MNYADAEFYEVRQFLVDDPKLKEMFCHALLSSPSISRLLRWCLRNTLNREVKFLVSDYATQYKRAPLLE